jgi:hypothetical protein
MEKIVKYSTIKHENSQKEIWLRLWIYRLVKKHKKELKEERGIDVQPINITFGFMNDDFAQNNLTIAIQYEQFNN